MTTLQIDSDVPELTPAQSLAGWRREICIEFVADAAARVFVRAVEESSFKASELQRATLFHRLPPQFRDLSRCVEAIGPDLHRLVESAKRSRPDKANLFTAVTYDRPAWERVQEAIARWGKQRNP